MPRAVRDPRWGRGLESPGECPHINSRYAAAFVLGFQNDTATDPHHLKASACCKHFSAYSFENSTKHGTDRYHFDAQVSKADLEESYLPPFRACVSEGQASGVMCSYNSTCSPCNIGENG